MRNRDVLQYLLFIFMLLASVGIMLWLAIWLFEGI